MSATDAPTKSAGRPAAFLDRDGVLIEDRGYVHRAEDLVWVPDAARAVRRLNEAGFFVFVVTNQAGVGRGFYQEEDVENLHAHMSEVLADNGARIDAYRFCPHHPEALVDAYRLVCQCRKPAPGMIEALCGDYPVTREASFLIGDRESDLEAARAARISAHPFDLARTASLDALVSAILRAR